jgi:hypothetical protein
MAIDNVGRKVAYDGFNDWEIIEQKPYEYPNGLAVPGFIIQRGNHEIHVSAGVVFFTDLG